MMKENEQLAIRSTSEEESKRMMEHRAAEKLILDDEIIEVDSACGKLSIKYLRNLNISGLIADEIMTPSIMKKSSDDDEINFSWGIFNPTKVRE